MSTDKISFTLKGRSGPVFYTNGAPVSGHAAICIHGVTKDGKLQTTARYADVDFTNHYITGE